MSTPLDTLASVLTPIAAGLDVAAAAVPGIGGMVMRVIAAASRFAADLATKGVDPITHIERIHAADPLLKDVRSVWRDRLDEEYPG